MGGVWEEREKSISPVRYAGLCTGYQDRAWTKNESQGHQEVKGNGTKKERALERGR